MHPLPCRSRPRVTVFAIRIDPEKNLHPANRGPFHCGLPIGHTQRDRPLRCRSQRELIFAECARLPAHVVSVAGSTNTDRIGFLRVNRRPIAQPLSRFSLQRLESLLGNAASARIKIKAREEVCRISNSARRTLRVKIRRYTDSCCGRFDQIPKLPSANLATLGRSQQKRFSFNDTPLAFAMTAAFYRASVQDPVLLIELVDLSIGDEFLVERRPSFFV